MRLAIVGSATGWDTGPADQALLYIEYALEILQPNILISGGAPGVDTWAEEEAMSRGIATHIYYPTNHQWEPNGYRERNILIATDCDWLIAIRHSKSKTYGSGWTADYALKLGKEVRRFNL